MTVLHIFSGDLWAGAEVVIFNLLTRLNQDGGPRVMALSLNEGVWHAGRVERGRRHSGNRDPRRARIR